MNAGYGRMDVGSRGTHHNSSATKEIEVASAEDEELCQMKTICRDQSTI